MTEDKLSNFIPELREIIAKVRKIVKVFERRNPELAHLIKFFELAFLDESHDECGVKIQKTKIIHATNLMKRLFKANEADQDDDGFEIEVEDVTEENKEVSKMEIFLYDEQDPQQSQLECGFVSHIIKKEIQLFQATKKRPENLDKLYRCLTTIRTNLSGSRKSFFCNDPFCKQMKKPT